MRQFFGKNNSKGYVWANLGILENEKGLHFFFLFTFLLECGCFTTWCWLLLCSKVTQLHLYLHPLFYFQFSSH